METAFQQMIQLLKAIATGLGGGGSTGKYRSVFLNVGSGAPVVIPVGVLSWSATGLSGLTTWNDGTGNQFITSGTTIRGGGYPGFKNSTAMTIATPGSAHVIYDIEV